MKKTILLSLLTICTLSLNAQNLDNLSTKELEERIVWFQECFNDMSLPQPHEDTITLSNGKVIKVLAQSDFERSAFVSADQLLADIQEWRDSPYLWQMKHRRNNAAVMDGKDLSKWEIKNFEQISQSYFENSASTYHIAAHGLVDERGVATDGIQIDGQRLNAAETAEFIIASMKDAFHYIINVKELPFVVIVHSCHVADGEDNFSSQLSKELAKYIPNATVVGAPQTVYCLEENGKYTEYAAPSNQLNQDNPQKLKWKTYKNGVNTQQGKYDYKETVSVVQKAQEK